MEWSVPDNLKMVIFDLDETLQFNRLQFMPNKVKDILHFFRKNNVIIALASLNSGAIAQLDSHCILHVFNDTETRMCREHCITDDEIKEHTSLRKVRMFRRLMARNNVDAESTLFFDDCQLNIIDAKMMNMKSVHVDRKHLITWRNVHDGLSLFKDKRKRRHTI